MATTELEISAAESAPLPLVETLPAKQRRRLFRITSHGVIGTITTMIVLWLVAVPLGFLVFTSFRDTRDGLPFESSTPFTLRNYRALLSRKTLDLIVTTGIYSVGAVFVALVVVVTFAYLIERTDLRFRRVIQAMILAPMALPPFIAGMAWTLLGNSRTGLINRWLRGLFGMSGTEGPVNIFSMPGMIMITGLMFVPAMYLMVSGTFGQMDPSLEEASWLSGVRRWSTIFRVTLPVLLPGIAAAIIYFIVTGFEIFEIPALLGLRERRYTLSTWTVYVIENRNSAFPDYGLGAAYGVLAVVTVGILLGIYWRIIHRRRKSFSTIGGRGFRRQRVELGRWNYLALAGAGVYCLVAFLLPVGVLVLRSLLPSYSQITDFGDLTFTHYGRLIHNHSLRGSAMNSLKVSTAVALFGTLLSTAVAWLSIRSKSRWGQFADQLTFLSMGMPGAILAIACILVYLWVPLPIYGTIWIIVIGLVARYLAFGVRVMSSALLQIKAELEEASWTSGVGPFTTLRTVIIPLVRPSLSRAALWMFVSGFRDGTIAIIAASATNRTFATEIWRTWFDDGDISYASAMAMPVALLSVILTIFIGRQYRGAGRHTESAPAETTTTSSVVAASTGGVPNA